MTTRTRHNVKCACGHVGHITQTENDQPYGECWDSYTPVNIGGKTVKYNKAMDWPDIFNDMNLVCEGCGQALDPANLE